MNACLDTLAGPQSGRRFDMNLETQLADETRRAEERSRWESAILTKVRLCRWYELTPAERGWIESKLVAGADA